MRPHFSPCSTTLVLLLALFLPATLAAESPRQLGALVIDDYTSSPLVLLHKARVEAPQAEVFSYLTDPQQLEKWLPGVRNVRLDHSGSVSRDRVGAGSVRSCEFRGQLMVENLPYWEPPRSYAYSIDTESSSVSLLFTDHLGIFTVEPDGVGASVITWRQYFRKSRGLKAQLMVPYLSRFMMRKAMSNLVNHFGGQLLKE